MNNIEFANMAKTIASKYKTLYVMGCFGAPMTPTNKERYIKHHSYNSQPTQKSLINSATSDTFGFDCVCLIKGILWGWSGNKNKTYGGATYLSNDVPDITADDLFTKCKDVSSDFSIIEVGEVLWMKGHIGIYIGNGLAVEATNIWNHGVQITAVGNIAPKKGYNGRTWSKHGKLPYITFSQPSETDYVELGKAFEKALNDINNLESVQNLLKLSKV